MEAIKSKADDIVQIRRERFVRIVERRVNKVLDNLDSLGKCANRKNYEYSAQDVMRIFQAIDKKMKAIRALYENSNQEKNAFRLQR